MVCSKIAVIAGAGCGQSQKPGATAGSDGCQGAGTWAILCCFFKYMNQEGICRFHPCRQMAWHGLGLSSAVPRIGRDLPTLVCGVLELAFPPSFGSSPCILCVYGFLVLLHSAVLLCHAVLLVTVMIAKWILSFSLCFKLHCNCSYKK